MRGSGTGGLGGPGGALCRLLLAAHPREVRDAFGAEMLETTARRAAEIVGAARVAFWWRECRAFARSAFEAPHGRVAGTTPRST